METVELMDRLRICITDWDGSRLKDEEPPMDLLRAGDIGRAISEIERLRRQRDELLVALNGLFDLANGFSVSGVYFNEFAEHRKALNAAIKAIDSVEIAKTK